jgi:hypothetical protein
MAKAQREKGELKGQCVCDFRGKKWYIGMRCEELIL